MKNIFIVIGRVVSLLVLIIGDISGWIVFSKKTMSLFEADAWIFIHCIIGIIFFVWSWIAKFD